MLTTRLSIVIVFTSALFATPAVALVTDDTAGSEVDPAGTVGLNWDYVYNYKGCSAVAVDTHWLVTTAHVADDEPGWSRDIGGTTYTEQEVVYHSAGDDPEHATDADLALVRLDKALPGHYEIYTGSYPLSPASERLEAVLVAHGRSGTVASGGEFYSGTAGTEGTKRWGTNVIDGIDPTLSEAGYTYEAIKMDFSEGDTAYEAGADGCDSGGGVFVRDAADGDTWKLGGTITVVFGEEGSRTSTGAAELAAYNTWITGTVPEPMSMSLLALGATAVLRRRR